jgi:DNA-directed RNA polymerase specialized sigma24 family protein
MSDSQQPSLQALIDLFERMRQRDATARSELSQWFQHVRSAIVEGVQARHQLESLAYRISEQDAARQIRPGGSFPRLRHDPGSVAFRHNQRLGPFLEALQRGEDKTVDQFVSAVSVLTPYVLLDMQKEDAADPVQSPAEDLAQNDAGPAADQEMSREEQLALLGEIYGRLTQEQFIILLLVRYAGMTYANVARLMGMEEHNVRFRLEQIARVVAQMSGGEE